jgi:hypothetical protein
LLVGLEAGAAAALPPYEAEALRGPGGSAGSSKRYKRKKTPNITNQCARIHYRSLDSLLFCKLFPFLSHSFAVIPSACWILAFPLSEIRRSAAHRTLLHVHRSLLRGGLLDTLRVRHRRSPADWLTHDEEREIEKWTRADERGARRTDSEGHQAAVPLIHLQCTRQEY